MVKTIVTLEVSVEYVIMKIHLSSDRTVEDRRALFALILSVAPETAEATQEEEDDDPRIIIVRGVREELMCIAGRLLERNWQNVHSSQNTHAKLNSLAEKFQHATLGDNMEER